MSWGYYSFAPYVPVARRRANAAAYAAKLAKKEKRELSPIALTGRKIATSFWGMSWCENLERYSDFANRLPRGRSYVRNGSVIDLQILRGKVKAIVSGSNIYRVEIDITTLASCRWNTIKQECSRSIDSLIDLLQGRFDQGIMQRLTERDTGLFPSPKEIKLSCTCPDWASMCKHVAATLYGVGARLDTAPELLFTLRAVDHLELISQAVGADNLSEALAGKAESALPNSELGQIFGIELEGNGSVSAETKNGATSRGDKEAPAATPKPRATRKLASSPKKSRNPARSEPAKPTVAATSRPKKTPAKRVQRRRAASRS